MIDVETARRLGLNIQVATAEKNWGSFIGPSGNPVDYFGRIQGPIRIKIGASIYLDVPDMKVVTHREPLLLLGTDVLVNGWNDWKFHYVGIHKTRKVGVMSVIRNSDN